jgi:uncharacterized delta-60 repeat protein
MLRTTSIRVLALCASTLCGWNASARELSFDQRVEAQKAIERVYFTHRSWPTDNSVAKPTFEATSPHGALAARVVDYLAKSTELTAFDLQAEIDRMARDTRDPGLLRELFAALGNDPFVIAETLARQNLAGTRHPGNASTAATELRVPGSAYILPEIGGGVSVTSTTPAARFGQTSVWTGNAMIVWGSESFANTGSLYDPVLDTWTPTSTGAGVPTGRGRHTAVWTGSEMIVWGGLTAGGETNTGARYVPATDAWTAISTGANCPSARQKHTAVWTGSQMIVFGGSAGSAFYNSGGLYDPLTDTWAPTSTGTNVPSIRDQHTAVWTGTQMIVWGGSDATVRLSTGSRYTPATDSWTALPTVAAPVARNRHTAVWTGTVMIVWGGFAPPYLNSGSRYNPTMNSWSTTIPTGAPSIRGGHTAVWTGSEMVVFGGQNATVALDNGGRYNPTTNVWTTVAAAPGSPAARYGHAAVWTGAEMLVWGGTSGTSGLDTGGRYKSFSSAWTDTATAAPGIRFHPRAAAKPIGAPAIFSVMARGDSPLIYHWRKSGVDLSDGPGVSGTGSDVLRLSAVHAGDAGVYSVSVTNGAGSVISNDAALTVNSPQAGDLDVAFKKRPGIDAPYTFGTAVQADGKVIIIGRFTSVYGAARGRIARLNPDGTNDDTFMNGLTGANEVIGDVLVQPDGKILIVGDFSEVNGVAQGGMARLNPDGSLDTTFSVGSGVFVPFERVLMLALAPDGKIIAAGNFLSFNGQGGRNSIVRLNPDGSLDNSWAHGSGTGIPYSYIVTTAVQPDGKVLIGGRFDEVNGEPKAFMARLNPDGTNDNTFQNGMSGADWDVRSISLAADGRLAISGGFAAINGLARPGFAWLNSDGSVDTAPPPAAPYPVTTAMQPDGKLILAGGFADVNGIPRSGIARLNRDGTLDTTFQNGMSGLAGGYGYEVSIARNGQIVVAGTFQTVNGVPRAYVAKLNSDGSLDTTFMPPAPTLVASTNQTLELSDGRILVSGSFQELDGVAGRGIARLAADGNVDPTFHASLDDGSVWLFARQPDGRLVIAGSFTSIGGVARNRIARLNADGSLDTTFQNGMTGLDQPPSAIALLPDGRILMAGPFATVNGVGQAEMARLNADGSLDPSFQLTVTPPSDPYDVAIGALALQPDGKVIIAGIFNTVSGVARARVARVNDDGTLDATFVDPKVSGFEVLSLALQPDGRVIIGGEFGGINGVPRSRLARLNADGTLDTTFLDGMAVLPNTYSLYRVSTISLVADGRILIGGAFPSINGVRRGSLARLNADGSVDTSFQDGMTGADGWQSSTRQIVSHISLQADGRVLVAGHLGTMNGENTGPIVRLYGTAPVAPAITAQPAAQASHDGSCAVFHVGTSGTPVDYRWRKGGVDLVDSAVVAGSKSATLTLTGVSPGSAGDYDVVIGNVLGGDTSITAPLSVGAVPACRVATCDAALGSVLVVAADGAACSDGNLCTASDSCSAGVCTPGPPVPPPAEIAALRVDGDAPSTLSWSDPGGALFDVASSSLSDLRITGATGATCLANDVATAIYADGLVPSPGNGVYYLVRGQSACGDGTYGTNSAGTPRTPAAACP